LITHVGKFEKVSLIQFSGDMKATFGDRFSDDEIKDIYHKIPLPERATKDSAGYDIKIPIDVCLEPGQGVKLPTGLRVRIDEGWWLGCFSRSGLGFKYRLQLDNGTGVIDGDYYTAKNEGHIFAKILNDSREGKTVTLKAGTWKTPGDGFIQAIFLPYGITYDDTADGIRNGGMGSTDK
jgi:dUTP pyrophosphatase